MSSNDLEQEIHAVGADKAPRVTLADIEANIVSEHYFTAAEGCAGHCNMAVEPSGWVPPLNRLTFCVLVLKNDFIITGESACVSPENFNAGIGRKVARDQAISKMWPLMGYELQSRLAQEQKS